MEGEKLFQESTCTHVSFWITIFSCPLCDICLTIIREQIKSCCHLVFGKSNQNCINKSPGKMTSQRVFFNWLSQAIDWLFKMWRYVVYLLIYLFYEFCYSLSCVCVFKKGFWRFLFLHLFLLPWVSSQTW